MKSVRIPAILLCLAAIACAHPAIAAPDGRTLTDQSGRQVVVPSAPGRIADLWYAHNELLIMLGGASSIAVTVETPLRSPWMFKVAPGLGKAIELSSTTPNAEALLAAGVDLAFATKGTGSVESIRRIGIPTLEVEFTDTASLMRCLQLTADALGTSEAKTVAARYAAGLADTIRTVRAVTDPIPAAARPRVLHIMSLSPLLVDGAGTIIDNWITIAGGRNAADGLSGNMKPVSVEQIAAWNPDIIILGGTAGTLDVKNAGQLWQSVKAVRDGRIYRNPAGVFAWDRYGSEILLQLRWAAKTLHPDLFRSTDMVELTRSFYRDFLSYPLRTDEAQRMIDALPPA